MSDVAQGPGWWQASDGRWYPPTAAPGPGPAPARPTPTPTPPPFAPAGTAVRPAGRPSARPSNPPGATGLAVDPYVPGEPPATTLATRLSAQQALTSMAPAQRRIDAAAAVHGEGDASSVGTLAAGPSPFDEVHATATAIDQEEGALRQHEAEAHRLDQLLQAQQSRDRQLRVRLIVIGIVVAAVLALVLFLVVL